MCKHTHTHAQIIKYASQKQAKTKQASHWSPSEDAREGTWASLEAQTVKNLLVI